jgi:DNA replication protein DnaC
VKDAIKTKNESCDARELHLFRATTRGWQKQVEEGISNFELLDVAGATWLTYQICCDFAELMRKVNLCFEAKSGANMVVTGNPGTGKSRFYIYCIFQFLKRKSRNCLRLI